MDVLQRIIEIRERRGWTEWRLSEVSGITQSTISAWYKKNRCPSIASLEKICAAFEMSLSQFFASDGDTVDLTPDQRKMLENWNALSKRQKEILLMLMENMPTKEE